MRYFWIAVGVATLHRIVTSGIALFAFGLGMSAFNGSSAASLCPPLLWLSGLLDFPSVLLKYLTFRLKTGHFPSSNIAEIYGAVLAPSIWMFGWSLCVGVIVAVALFRRDRAKPTFNPSAYWKSGL